MSTNPNQYYLDGLRQHTPAVLNQIFREFLPPVIAYVKSNQGTQEDARDVFMYALEVLYGKVRDDNFTLTAAFFTYLYEVCRRRWLKELRRKKFDAGVTPDAPVVSTNILDESVDHTLEIIERQRLFKEKFQGLQEDCRKILGLSWHTDMNMKDIAEEMNMSYDYVRKRKHVCKEYLVNAIQSDPRFHELQA